MKFYRLQQRRRRVNDLGYSFKQFDEHRCIFVHIPKCAGVSICTSLFGNLGGGHATIETYQIAFSPAEFDAYFKFTFVRNPWDRVVSAFTFLKRGGFDEEDRRWAREHLTPYPDFSAFVSEWLSPENARTKIHFRPQLDFLRAGSSEPLVDFIGYYENLNTDFSFVCQKLGINPDLRRLNVSQALKHDYAKYYTEETRDKVAAVYEDDIRVLGYSFDNSSLPAQLATRNVAGPSLQRAQVM